MNFRIPAGASTELPKEVVDVVINQAIEKSKVLSLVEARGNFREVRNEGSLPVYGNMDETKIFRLDTTADVSTLDENTFTQQAPTLNPVEVGTFAWLSKKEAAQYSDEELDKLYESKMSDAMATAVEVMALRGDTSIVGATNYRNICDGISTIAGDATKAAVSPVAYTTSNSASIIDTVIDAQEALGLYGNEDQKPNLIVFAGSGFASALKKSASTLNVGYDSLDVPALGLMKVPHADGIPVVSSSQIGRNDAVLVNINGLFGGYRQKLEVETDYVTQKRATYIQMTFHLDFVWAMLNDDGKAEGMVKISKSS
jgi:hypothetical protein